MNDKLIRVDHLSKKFCKSLRRSLWYGVQDIAAEFALWRKYPQRPLRSGEFWALEDVSFALEKGEALGVIGPNGAGKSTLLRVLNGLMKPDAGRIEVNGRLGALIELGAGFNPILTGRENIYINGAILSLSREQIDGLMDEIIDFAGVRDFIDAPVKNYSTGMRMRLGYAVAAYLQPDLLLVDEVLAVGDMEFRRKCIQHMLKYLQEGGSMILVTHDMHLMQSVCTRSVLLDHGKVVFKGSAVQGVSRYFELQGDELSKNGAGSHDSQAETDQPLIITELRIEALDGTELETGKDTVITLHYRATEVFEKVFWAFAIWTGDQAVCVTGGLDGLDADTYSIAKGEGELICTLPKLPLAAGSYLLRAGIADVQTRAPIARYGYENAPVFFTLRPRVNEAENLHLATGALVEIDIEWG